jgi:hypothetical protein
MPKLFRVSAGPVGRFKNKPTSPCYFVDLFSVSPTSIPSRSIFTKNGYAYGFGFLDDVDGYDSLDD